MDRYRISIIVIAAALGACESHHDDPAASILLFNGTGTSRNDVAAVESILRASRLSYSTVTSRRLNAMSQADIRRYRLVIVPGGNFVDIGNNLTASAAENVRNAVRSGTNYVGICAGAFFAGDSPFNGLNLTSGVRFHFYAAEDRGIHKTAVPISIVQGRTLEHYWEDGPQLNGWGDVVAKYPDGTAAVAEGTYGSGWVILSGVHPEAPASWRRGMSFNTPASADHEYAAALIRAAYDRVSLPHY
ncbi:MAG TPA: BPL-N domain-containing protein [Bryobacteraceae bacterium]